MRKAVARSVLALAGASVLAVPAAAWADSGSLYSGPGPRPGPAVLYALPATAPQLTNTSRWTAAPLLVSGASAYRDGEFLYQDFLYDDHGANGRSPADPAARDPNDPRLGFEGGNSPTNGDGFSQPNGTYTYPRDRRYRENAADLVELRVKPMGDGTALRLTYNTMVDPSLVAATVAIGTSASPVRAFPHGARATARADLFLTVHAGSAELLQAAAPQTPAGSGLTATVDLARRQVEVVIPHSAWNPGRSVVRLTAGTGLWGGTGYLLPRQQSDATHPGGLSPAYAATASAFFNVAFRTAEPFPSAHDAGNGTTEPAWWRDRAQGDALRTGDLSAFHADVDFGALLDRVTRDVVLPRTGAFDRIGTSHEESDQGADFSHGCASSAGCRGELRGRLQPYAVYVPPSHGPRYGLTLLLHSLAGNYNQYLGSRNESQFGDRSPGSIVVTPSGRGPDGWYYDAAGADTFEAWADVAARYPLDAALTTVTGYSMGGYGTYKFATQYPDLFAKGQPTVGPPGLGIWTVVAPPEPGGEQSNTYDQLGSLRNMPVDMWVEKSDELVPFVGTQQQARGVDALGYRYEFRSYSVGEHLTLAVNDEFGPAAAFLGATRVDRNPPHVTFVRNPSMDFPAVGTTADHAYWLSRITTRDPSTLRGTVDARSEGFGVGDPPARPTTVGAGVLTGGTLGAIPFDSQMRTWGPTPAAPVRDVLHVTARNIRVVAVSVARARVDCRVRLDVSTDGPLTVLLPECGRSDTFGAGGTAPAVTRADATRSLAATGGGGAAPAAAVLALLGLLGRRATRRHRPGRT